MARRLLYFPLLVNEIKRHFGSISRGVVEAGGAGLQESSSVSSLRSSRSLQCEKTTSAVTSTWFTCKFNDETLVIPLHLPIGLIFDLVAVRNTDNNTTHSLPWKLEFHISNTKTPADTLNPSPHFPLEHYAPFADESHLSGFYFSALKEADHLRSGSAKNVMNLSRAEQIQLWESLRGGECDRFWRINQKLIGNSVVKSVPIKFWICNNDKGALSRFQFLVPYTNPSKFLHELLSEEFARSFKRILLHGVDLPTNVTLEELNCNWNYADNFINLLLVT